MTNSHRLKVLFLTATVMAGLPPAQHLDAQGPPRDLRPQVPAAPPRDAGTAPKPVVGTGAISGVVTVAGSGQPARRARVSISGSEQGSSRSTTTDETGGFSAVGLPAGRYTVSASKVGYIGGSFGQRVPGRSGAAIQLADGQKQQVRVQIWRGSVITGTVLDESGEAIPNTPVRVLRYVMTSGQRTLQQGGNGQTDDRGVYRIFNLQPGEYLVSATPRQTLRPGVEGDAARVLATTTFLEGVSVNTANPAAAQAIAERVAQMRVDLGQPGVMEEASTGYAPVYYPGTTAIASAASVVVGAGEEKAGIDFQYQVVPVARVEGVVTMSAGQLPANVTLTLTSQGANGQGINLGARADGQGSFRINSVPPGQYTLIARASVVPGREGGPARGGPPPGGRGENPFGARGGRAGTPAADPLRFWGSTEIGVDGRNVTGVAIALQQGVQVSGRVAFDGTTLQPPTDLSRMRVSLQPLTTPGEVSTSASGRVEADGRFTVTSVVPGRYRLMASGAGAGWTLGSSSLEGQDALDALVEIKGAASGALVTFVDRQSELTGTITDERAQPVFDYTLIVYPSDQRYRTPQSRRIMSTRPATDGRYTFRNLPAGEYRIAPVLDPEPGSWFDPAFLQQLDGGALRLTIGESEKKEQNLRVPGGA